MIILFAVVDIKLPQSWFMEVKAGKEFGKLCLDMYQLSEEK